MFGKGLLKGLSITWKEFTSKKFTVQYPEQQHPKPERFHGRFELKVDACIACNLCANACPNNVIKITSARVNKKRYLVKYVMDIQYCLFCGFCVEACNKKGLTFTSEHDMSQYHYDDIPLVLAEREIPVPEPEPVDEKLQSEVKAKAKADKVVDKGKKTEQAPAAGESKAPDKEGQ